MLSKRVFGLLVYALCIVGCKTQDPEQLLIDAAPKPAAVMVREQTNTRCARAAVTFGLTKVDPAKWRGWDGACPGADVDEAAVREYVDHCGAFGKRVRVADLGATKYGVTAAAIFAAQGLKAGDLLFISGSCHGGEKDNADPEEAEWKDQYVCLADGPLTDDVIWQLLCQATKDIPGLRIVLWLDMCNSRTMWRGGPRKPHDYADGVRKRMAAAARSRADGYRAEQFNGSLLVISGCDDGKSSYGDAAGGGTLTRCGFRDGHPAGKTWREWFEDTKGRMPEWQVPYLSEAGPSFADMPAMR